mgnify:CR=1 FL=1
MAEEYPDSPLVRYVRTHVYDAASQIEALQMAAARFASDWHWHGLVSQVAGGGHERNFADCSVPECRKLRDRLRPIGRIETEAPS